MSISESRAVSMITGTGPALAQLAADLGAGDAGHHQVEQHDVGARPVVRGQALGPVGGLDHLEALAAEHVGERLAVGRLVLHDQHAGHERTSFHAVLRCSRRGWLLHGVLLGSGRRSGPRGPRPRTCGEVGRDRDREGRPAAELAPDADPAAVAGGDVLDDGQAEPRAAVRPAAAVVDAVEAFEDAVGVGGGDADAGVGDGDLDVVVLAVRPGVGGDDDPGARVGVDDGVLDQVADGGAELAGVAEHLGAVGAGEGQRDPALLGVDPAAVDRVVQHLVDRRRPGARRAGRRPAAGRGR